VRRAVENDQFLRLRSFLILLANSGKARPVPAGVVFLKNMRTNTIRSYISDETGNYRFSGLDPNADYELHAEKDGAKSQTRSISSYDSRKDIILNLKLDKKTS